MKKMLVAVQYENGRVALAEEKEKDQFDWVHDAPPHLMQEFPEHASKELLQYLFGLAVAGLSMGRDSASLKSPMHPSVFDGVLPPLPSENGSNAKITRCMAFYI